MASSFLSESDIVHTYEYMKYIKLKLNVEIELGLKTRAVHKKFFLELSKIPGSFMWHFNPTRSYAALRAADLDWIVGPGYCLGGYILEKNHENQPKTMKNHEKPTWNH